MLGEYLSDPSYLGRKVGTSEAEENHTGMGTSVSEHQLTEVTVVGNDDALLAVTKREDVFVRHIMRMVAADAGDVVSIGDENRNEPSVDVLVEQKPHGRTAGTPNGACLSCSTAARAYARTALTSSRVNSG